MLCTDSHTSSVWRPAVTEITHQSVAIVMSHYSSPPPPPPHTHTHTHSMSGEQLLDLFSHVPTTKLNLDLLKDNPNVGDIALQAAIVPSQCKLLPLGTTPLTTLHCLFPYCRSATASPSNRRTVCQWREGGRGRHILTIPSHVAWQPECVQSG